MKLSAITAVPIAALIAVTPAHARRHHNPWRHHLQELAYQNLAALLSADPAIMAAITASNPALAAVILNLAQLASNRRAPVPQHAAAPPPSPPKAVRPPIVTVPPTATTPAISFNAPTPGLSVLTPAIITGSPPPAAAPLPSDRPAPTPGELAPFADSNCPGETYNNNFSGGLAGWNIGGTNDLSDGNDKMASYQASTQNAAIATTSRGLDLSVVNSGGTLLGAMINTHRKFAQQYGYFEMTANLDQAMLSSGTTTAFWLMPENGGWPPENDIQETVGRVADTALHGHSGTPQESVSYTNIDSKAHVWATDWEPDKTTWYLDGKQVAQADTPSDFHQPMYMVLDAMAHDPNASGTMNVQSIRVFNSMASALACVPSAVTTAPQVAAITPQTSLDVIHTTPFKTNSPLTSGGTR